MDRKIVIELDLDGVRTISLRSTSNDSWESAWTGILYRATNQGAVGTRISGFAVYPNQSLSGEAVRWALQRGLRFSKVFEVTDHQESNELVFVKIRQMQPSDPGINDLGPVVRARQL